MKFGKRVAFYTLGCKVNQYETESIKKQFLEEGYEEVSFQEKSDYYIVNSCTVTSIADKKTRNILSRAKKSNKNSVVIITGCYAQTDGESLLGKDYIDYVVGNTNKTDILKLVRSIDEKKDIQKIISHNIFDDHEYCELEFATMREMSRAYVKIQDGCNEFCSYCKIPFARGRSRSRKLNSILTEVEILIGEGYKEIILIGINMGVYGEDLEEGKNFEDLLEAVTEIEGVERVRLGSIYPDKINDKFINIMVNNSKMMPHLHISLQSCDDEILKLMKRKYGTALIKDRLLRLKEKVKDLEFTADVIVGFPQEKDENFKNTYNLISEIGFSNLHIFPYSDRENTVASKLSGKVDGNTKKNRAKKLESLRKEMEQLSKENNSGKTTKVLVETIKDDYAYGYTENYNRIKIVDSGYKVSEIVEVEIYLEEGKLYGKETKKI
ncbi:MAG: tRNA (N(6)-L-threonylcarbamoyladenosine(37)-C(2))-methylthiotransferase MtaB [Fusobacteriia bacterium 4572_74]|nr:MAG: tRNA (N(6)-L-threonylcarbamoyladenosine(37)-C(2))-methylthiotransferase MtaB [Fusobacteriia bacterium 4572_74]